MKNIDTKISILNNSNRIIASSKTDWSTLRANSNIFVGNDKFPYTVTEAKKFFYIKPFTVVDEQSIKIEDSIKHNLLPDDVIDLSYNEFYAIECILVEEAEESAEKILVHKDFVEPVKIKTKKGSKEAEVIDGGKSLEKVEVVDNVFLRYNEFSDRKVLKYEILNIDIANSIILLNKVLPDKVKSGKISVQKWEAFLNAPYMSHDRINVNCHVTRDFTPNLGLPLVPTFGPAQSATINEALKKLDIEIQAIKRKVGL